MLSCLTSKTNFSKLLWQLQEANSLDSQGSAASPKKTLGSANRWRKEEQPDLTDLTDQLTLRFGFPYDNFHRNTEVRWPCGRRRACPRGSATRVPRAKCRPVRKAAPNFAWQKKQFVSLSHPTWTFTFSNPLKVFKSLGQNLATSGAIDDLSHLFCFVLGRLLCVGKRYPYDSQRMRFSIQPKIPEQIGLRNLSISFDSIRIPLFWYFSCLHSSRPVPFASHAVAPNDPRFPLRPRSRPRERRLFGHQKYV